MFFIDPLEQFQVIFYFIQTVQYYYFFIYLIDSLSLFYAVIVIFVGLFFLESLNFLNTNKLYSYQSKVYLVIFFI